MNMYLDARHFYLKTKMRDILNYDSCAKTVNQSYKQWWTGIKSKLENYNCT